MKVECALDKACTLLTPKRIFLYALAIATSAWLLFIIVHFRAYGIGIKPSGDFLAFYTAAHMARTEPQNLYNLSAQRDTQKQLLPGLPATRRWQYLHPPFFSILLIPLGRLSYLQAYWMWTTTSFLLYMFSIWVLARVLPSAKAEIVQVFLIAISQFPFLWCIMSGQTTTLGLLVWALAFYLLKEGREFSSGILLGLLAYRFQSLIVLLPLLFWKRVHKVVTGLAISSSMLVIAGGLVFGFQSYTQYLRVLLTSLKQMEDILYPFTKSVSLFGFFRLLLPNDFAIGATILAATILIYWLLRVWQGPVEPQRPIFDLQISMTITVTLLLMHHSLIYDLMLLTIPAPLVYEHRLLFPRYCNLLLALIWVAPYFWFATGVEGKIWLNPIQPLLFWLSYEIFSAAEKMRQPS